MHILVLLLHIELVDAYRYTHALGPYGPSTPHPKSYGREGFGWLQVWASEEREWRNKMQNLVNTFPDIHFALICENTVGVCV